MNCMLVFSESLEFICSVFSSLCLLDFMSEDPFNERLTKVEINFVKYQNFIRKDIKMSNLGNDNLILYLLTKVYFLDRFLGT